MTSNKRIHVGMRNIKTGLSVLVCLLIYHITGLLSDPLLACITAIICMQDSVEKSVAAARHRLAGTALGALLGMLLLYLNGLINVFDLTLFLAVLGIMLFIVLCNMLGSSDAIVVGCVVLLSIVLLPTDQSPLLYSVTRLLDTFIGIFVAVLINRFVINPFKRKSHKKSA